MPVKQPCLRVPAVSPLPLGPADATVMWEVRPGNQAMILVNGDLGKDLPFARGVPLGSGDFHLFLLKDLGILKLPGQFRRAFDGPDRWGFEHHRVTRSLSIAAADGDSFPVNVDGSTMVCRSVVSFRIVDQVRLMARA